MGTRIKICGIASADEARLAAQRPVFLAGGLNRASVEFVAYLPTGFLLSDTAWRRSVPGVGCAPFPVFQGMGVA